MKEKLIITGQIKDLEKSLKKWTSLSQGDELKILEGKVEGASSYLDWIMAVLLKHHELSTHRTDERTYFHGRDVDVELNVQGKTEVKADDTFTLAQRVDVRQLKLVTCVPEGTTLRRGVITAQLVKE